MDIKRCVVGICATNCYLISGDDFAVVIDPAENDNFITDFAQKNADKKYLHNRILRSVFLIVSP